MGLQKTLMFPRATCSTTYSLPRTQIETLRGKNLRWENAAESLVDEMVSIFSVNATHCSTDDFAVIGRIPVICYTINLQHAPRAICVQVISDNYILINRHSSLPYICCANRARLQINAMFLTLFFNTANSGQCCCCCYIL